jgi:transposase
MLILGVDIAKLNHVASLVDSNSNEIIFSNSSFKIISMGFLLLN